MTLREQLAERFCAELHRTQPEIYDKVPCSPISQSVLVLADECIRQMEWARNGLRQGWTCPHGYAGWTGAHQFCECFSPDQVGPPLTLALEEWKP